MRKPLLTLFIIVLLVRVWIWFGESDLFESQAADNTAVAGEEAQIAIKPGGIQPQTVSVRSGGEVEWINEANQARTLQSDNPDLDTAQVAPGEEFEWQAGDPGVIHYTLDAEGQEGHVVILGQDNQIAAKVETGGPGLFIRSHEESPYVWADTMFAEEPNDIYVLDKETFEVVNVIDEGSQTLHPEFTKDGSVVYVSDWLENVVRIYDATTFEKMAEVGGVETPTGIFNTHRRTETLGH